MTSNQLQYQKNAEERRHNLEMEEAQRYANVSGRMQAGASQLSAAGAYARGQAALADSTEKARHNMESERIEQANARTGGFRNVASGISSIIDSVDHVAQSATQVARTFV